jgi:hypothetical protein
LVAEVEAVWTYAESSQDAGAHYSRVVARLANASNPSFLACVFLLLVASLAGTSELCNSCLGTVKLCNLDLICIQKTLVVNN